MTPDQQEEVLLRSGWKQATEEMSDGRKVKLDFWLYQGEAEWYVNDCAQSEYVNRERRYTLKQASEIQRRFEETAVILKAKKAEAERRERLSGQKAVSAAEAAARAAEEALAS